MKYVPPDGQCGNFVPLRDINGLKSAQVTMSKFVLLFSNAHSWIAPSIVRRLFMHVLFREGPPRVGFGSCKTITAAIRKSVKMKPRLTRLRGLGVD